MIDNVLWLYSFAQGKEAYSEPCQTSTMEFFAKIKTESR